MNPFLDYSKKALSIVPARLLGPTKTRREAIEKYTQIVGELRVCCDRAALQSRLDEHRTQITQFHAELPFLWEGDGADFLGLDREIESAFETVEATSYFQFRSKAESGVGRLPGQLEAEKGLG